MKMDPVDWAYWNSTSSCRVVDLNDGLRHELCSANEMRIALIIFGPKELRDDTTQPFTRDVWITCMGLPFVTAGSYAGTLHQTGGPLVLSRRLHGDCVRMQWHGQSESGGAAVTVVEVFAPKDCVCWSATPDAYMG